jgi:hypothetical protein
MSEENVEIVRAQYASFGQITEGGEVHSWVLGYFDPNCEYRPVEKSCCAVQTDGRPRALQGFRREAPTGIEPV